MHQIQILLFISVFYSHALLLDEHEDFVVCRNGLAIQMQPHQFNVLAFCVMADESMSHAMLDVPAARSRILRSI